VAAEVSGELTDRVAEKALGELAKECGIKVGAFFGE